MSQQRVPVWVKALDPLSQAGLIHALGQRPEVRLVRDADLTAPADELPVVALVVVDTLDGVAVQVLRSANHRAGDGSLPPDLLGRLLGQVSRLQRHVLAPRGLSHTGLSDRETQVLRLVADGKDTQEIAKALAYSERTVKNVLHDITSRLQLRNRSHAVAYALREGLI